MTVPDDSGKAQNDRSRKIRPGYSRNSAFKVLQLLLFVLRQLDQILTVT